MESAQKRVKVVEVPHFIRSLRKSKQNITEVSQLCGVRGGRIVFFFFFTSSNAIITDRFREDRTSLYLYSNPLASFWTLFLKKGFWENVIFLNKAITIFEYGGKKMENRMLIMVAALFCIWFCTS